VLFVLSVCLEDEPSVFAVSGRTFWYSDVLQSASRYDKQGVGESNCIVPAREQEFPVCCSYLDRAFFALDFVTKRG
jgi:hypothetical protein